MTFQFFAYHLYMKLHSVSSIFHVLNKTTHIRKGSLFDASVTAAEERGIKWKKQHKVRQNTDNRNSIDDQKEWTTVIFTQDK